MKIFKLDYKHSIITRWSWRGFKWVYYKELNPNDVHNAAATDTLSEFINKSLCNEEAYMVWGVE